MSTEFDKNLINPGIWHELMTVLDLRIDRKYFEILYHPTRDEWLLTVTLKGKILYRSNSNLNLALTGLIAAIQQEQVKTGSS